MSLDFNVSSNYFPRFSRPVIVPGRTETQYVQVKVYMVFYKQAVIEWSIPSQWGACTFNVYFYHSPTGPIEKINKTPVSDNYFKDVSNRDISKFRNSHYIVEVRLPDGRYIVSPPATYQNKRSSWANIRATEIRRRESLLLTNFTGVDSFIFIRKGFGKRCEECWNKDIEKATKDHCQTCLGTGFEGGYFSGYRTLIQYEPTPSAIDYTAQGVIEPNSIPAWTIDYPEINSRDVILRVPDWKMFLVDSVQSTELQAVKVRQIMSLVELSKESIEFKLASQAIPEEYQ
jgi:hypothetical protein